MYMGWPVIVGINGKPTPANVIELKNIPQLG
jgi:hypothetical protein